MVFAPNLPALGYPPTSIPSDATSRQCFFQRVTKAPVGAAGNSPPRPTTADEWGGYIPISKNGAAAG